MTSDTTKMIPFSVMNISSSLRAIGGIELMFGTFQLSVPDLGIGKHITDPLPKAEGSYLLQLKVSNAGEAGGVFPYNAKGFGAVQCNVPTVGCNQ